MNTLILSVLILAAMIIYHSIVYTSRSSKELKYQHKFRLVLYDSSEITHLYFYDKYSEITFTRIIPEYPFMGTHHMCSPACKEIGRCLYPKQVIFPGCGARGKYHLLHVKISSYFPRIRTIHWQMTGGSSLAVITFDVIRNVAKEFQ